jgi:hypothetical protein
VPETKPTFGMRQLTSGALSAHSVFQWLIDCDDKKLLHVPLATCRLLLCPSPGEISLPPALAYGSADQATFESAANAWRCDASSRTGNVTFFYFAGHGVQRGPGDHVMLLAGFGKPKAPVLKEGVELKELTWGMAPSQKNARPHMGRNQLYFIDSCRVKPEAFKEHVDMKAAPFFEDVTTPDDGYPAPTIFYATAPNRAAFSKKGQQTFFCQALLNCLNGGAGVNNKVFDEKHDPRWCITANCLNDAIRYHLEKICQAEGLDQHYTIECPGKDIIISLLTGTPNVDVSLLVIPSCAHHLVRLRVRDEEFQVVNGYDARELNSHNELVQFLAGYYRIDATISPPKPCYHDVSGQREAKPPHIEWRIPVEPPPKNAGAAQDDAGPAS